MDQEENLVDSRLSQQRDLAAAKAFFEQTRDVAENSELVMTDGPRSYLQAIAEVLGP
jgi:transposase-like protein